MAPKGYLAQVNITNYTDVCSISTRSNESQTVGTVLY